MRYNDLTGQRFGMLTVLAPTEKRMDCGCVVWKCRCDCGNLAEVSARRLIRGKVKSCGCLNEHPPKDYVGKRFGRLTVLEYAGRERKSMEHSNASINYWKCRCDCGNVIIVSQPDLQRGNTLSCGCLHRERVRDSLCLVDGTSPVILERSRKSLRSSNTSGCTGVSQRKDGKWEAYINFKKKRYYLGRYYQKEDAVRVRKNAEGMHDEFLDWYYKECQNESSCVPVGKVEG